MAVLGRLKIAPNQRLDLPDINAFDSYSAGDWLNFMQGLTGGSPFILRGFDLINPATLINNPATQVNVNMTAAAMWWPAGSEGSFFVALPDAAADSVSLITSATNYIQARFTLVSGAQDARALWDPGANGGAGGEFTQVVDTEYVLTVVISVNNTGFDADAVSLATVVVNNSNVVTAITDCRPMLFRLGTGGANPDPLHSFLWPNLPLGYSQTDTVTTMTSSGDPNPFQGADKNIQSLKGWMDAVMSRIKDIDGGAKWFVGSGGASGSGGSLSLAELFLDSEAGHAPVPNRNVRLAWSQNSDGIFRSLDAVGVNQAISWKATVGQLTWSLGGSFVSSNNRAFATYTFAQAVGASQNLYLHLQRDAVLNSDPSVTFQNINGTTGSVSSPATGSFVGVAVGDFVRKKSGSTYQYYQVASIAVNNTTPFTNGTIFGTVADGTVQYMTIVTHDGPILTSTEPYRYFRTQYQTSDLVSSQYGLYDTSYYWIGANTAGMFYLRYYGDMQPGEETEVLDPSNGALPFSGGGSSNLLLRQSENAVYDPTNGYSLKTGSGTLLTLVRRLTDNTIGNPSNGDNSGASPTYTITAPVGTMNDGDGLWVRLSNAAGGTLTAGTVTNISTDNVYQKLPQSQNPLSVYNNLNVYLIARKYTINGVATLIFVDGTWLSLDGTWINNHFSVQQDLFLKEKTQWSIPFIGTTGGRVDENNAQLFWNNTAGQDSLGQFGVRNIRISEDSVTAHADYFTQAVPQDVFLFSNLGNHTLTIGQNNSTTVFPGSIVVQGTSSSVNTNVINITGKQIVLGVGNANNGGGDSGMVVADNTQSATSYSSTSGQIYIDIAYASPHGYVTGNVVWVDTNTAIGGITAGQINGAYTVKVTGSVAGDAQVTGANTLRVWTVATASSTATVNVTGGVTFVTFLTPSAFLMSDSSGNTTGMTSWMFQVKGVATTPTITPVAGYGIVPTANSTNFVRTRIPFANNDGAGPLGADTTLNFSSKLTWDGTNLNVDGNIIPETDNSWALGSTSLRWASGHFGPGSVVVHNDNTNTNWQKLLFNGAIAQLITNAATPLQLTTGANVGVYIDVAGKVGVNTSTGFTGVLNIGTNTTTSVGGAWFGTDTNLYRSALSVLKTDASMMIGAALTVGTDLSIGNANTSGSVLFVNSSTNVAQDNANFFWNDTTHRLGIGTNSPSTAIEVRSAADVGVTINQLTAGQTAFLSFQRNSTADWEFGTSDTNPSGTRGFYIYNYGASAFLLSASHTANEVAFVANITKIRNVAYSWPTVHGPVGSFLQDTDGAGTLSWVTSAASVATPTSQGVVTSYFPIVQSAVLNTSTTYTVLTADGYEAIAVTTGGSVITINLPAASSNNGRLLILKKVDSGVGQVLIVANGTDTVEGNATFSLISQYDSITLLCDSTGTTWFRMDTILATSSINGDVSTGSQTFAGLKTFNTGINTPGDLFHLNGSTGNIDKIRSIPYTWPAVQGVANSVLRNDSTGVLTWQPSNWNTTAVKTATYTAVTGEEVPANTTGGAFTVNLPASPSTSQRVRVIDYAGTWGTNNLTLGANGNNINGSSSNFTLNVNNSWIEAVYIDGTQGWRILT